MNNIQNILPFAEEVTPENGDAWVSVPHGKIVEACRLMRDKGGFDTFSCLTGTDRGDFFEVVYHLYSYKNNVSAVIKVRLDKNDLNIPSVTDVWDSADWMERETFDLLGINFVGHPDLRRILLPDDWVGHPLRKDYKDPVEYQGMEHVRK